MPSTIRSALIALSVLFLAVGIYHRIRAARGGDRLDRTKEGWPILIGMRLLGFLTFGGTAAWIWSPSHFAWAATEVPASLRWIGVSGFAGGVAWLIWMFVSLGTNLTDTVE